jgi:hypothetical protein
MGHASTRLVTRPWWSLEDLCSKVPPKLLKSKVKRGIAKGLTSMVEYWKEQGIPLLSPP